MKWWILFLVLVFLLVLGEIFMLRADHTLKISPSQQSIIFLPMILKSSAFSHNGNIPSKYTCDGENLRPHLSIENAPKNTKSFVLIVHDPDAPAKDWLHWTIWNIAPEIREIPENTVPYGTLQGMTDFGETGWGGPCPPSGTHRYFFELYALDTILDIAQGSDRKTLEDAISPHVIEKAQLIGLYKRT